MLVFCWFNGAEPAPFVVPGMVATWYAVFFMAATGVWCSTRSQSSGRSLVNTLAIGYGYVLGLLLLTVAGVAWGTCLLGIVMLLVILFAPGADPIVVAMHVYQSGEGGAVQLERAGDAARAGFDDDAAARWYRASLDRGRQALSL